jgi:hypothetical protein
MQFLAPLRRDDIRVFTMLDQIIYGEKRQVSGEDIFGRLCAASINTSMISSFNTWERRRRHLAPEAERILPFIAAAGWSGMTRRQIGNAIELDRDTLDQLIAGLVGIGLLTVAWERGVPVYRAGISGI